MATNYSGNNDFRGYVSYLAKNDSNAVNRQGYSNLLGIIGNDGGINFTNFKGLDTPFGYSVGSNGGSKLQADVTKLYNQYMTSYKNDLKGTANSSNNAVAAAIAALNAQPKLPKFDYAGSMARAGATAASTVNPVYQDKLNQYLAKAQAALGQKTVDVTRNKEDIGTALAAALEDSATSRTRTNEDTTTQLGDVAANENSWQRQEGRQFDAARMALLGSTADAGLTESGIGQGQVASAVTDRNLASEDQTRTFNNQRRDIQTVGSRTLQDLDKSDVREKAGSQRATENQDIDLNNFIQNSSLDEQSFRASNEAERVGAINSATQSAYSQIVAQTIQALAGSGARAQDIGLFKQVYG
jgi:hypothetical protein